MTFSCLFKLMHLSLILKEAIGPRDLRLKLQKKEEKQRPGIRDLREKLSGVVQSQLQKAEPAPAPIRPKPASEITKPVRYDPAVGAKQAVPKPASSKETLKQVWSISLTVSSSMSVSLVCAHACLCTCMPTCICRVWMCCVCVWERESGARMFNSCRRITISIAVNLVTIVIYRRSTEIDTVNFVFCFGLFSFYYLLFIVDRCGISWHWIYLMMVFIKSIHIRLKLKGFLVCCCLVGLQHYSSNIMQFD